MVSHIWNEEYTYTIRVKAIDIHGAKSGCETLEVTMPKYKAINIPIFLQRLLQRFPKFEKILKLFY